MIPEVSPRYILKSRSPDGGKSIPIRSFKKCALRKGKPDADGSERLGPAKSAGLIDLIGTIPFEHADVHAKDILGHIYEPSGARQTAEGSPQGECGGVHQYLLGQFALAEGKKGGQYLTPKSIVSLIVEMLEPYQGRVYDPAMGSGGFFVQSEKFIAEHGGKLGNLSVYGQDSNPTTWRLAAMNMAIRGIDFNFGNTLANSFTSHQHPDLRADYVMADRFLATLRDTLMPKLLSGGFASGIPDPTPTL